MVVVVLAVLLIVGASVGRREDPLDRVTAYGLACCASLVVSPLSWGHYYMALAPAALFAPIWLLRRGRPSYARVIAVIPTILIWSYYLAMPYIGGVGLLGIGTTVWMLAVCSSMLRSQLVGASAIAAPHFMPRVRPSRRSRRQGMISASPDDDVSSRALSGVRRERAGGHEPSAAGS
jgi:hypothetical protein